MSSGKLYILSGSPRSQVVVDIINYYNLDVEISSEKDERYHKAFPLGRTPTFIGPNGFELYECIAIVLYFLSLAPETKLLGKNKEEYASIIKYFSVLNGDIIDPIFTIAHFATGTPYDKKVHEECLVKLDQFGEIFENRLLNRNYLVGEGFSIADAFAAHVWIAAYTLVLGKPFADKHPNITRFIRSVSKNDFFDGKLNNISIPNTAWTYTPPKK